MMEHQPFETWIFTDEPLGPDDQAALQAHLKSCAECKILASAWSEVDRHLQAAPVVAPAPGFSDRWLERLEADKIRLQRRQSLALLGFSAAGAVLLLGSLALLLMPLIESPSVLVFAGLSRLLILFSTLGAAEDLLSVVFQTAASVIPPILWIFIVGFISVLGVLWIVSFRLLTNSRRLSQ